MKVFVALVLLIASVAAGSGPYLPSGWRPGGPAFYLPSEVQKPVHAVDVILQGSEGASSDSLREYGPPEVQVQNLPEDVNKPSFLVVRTNFGQDDAAEVAAEEVQSEVSEQQTAEDAAVPVTTETQEVSSSLEQNDEEVIPVVGEEPSSVSTNIGAEVETEVKAVNENVNNIAEAIVKLEKEEMLVSQDLAELKSDQQTGKSTLPEGFLEYGPPGFNEYGPPKQNSLLRTAAVTSEQEKIDSNETRRRRRFSPKFRSARKQRKAIH